MIGSFDPDSLADELINRWIPYLECHKCGRSDYCKYAEPHPYNQHKRKEIKCGIVSEVIRNFLERTFHLLSSYDEKQIQNYLDGLYNLQKYVYHSELEIGLLLDKGMLDFYDDIAPKNFGHLVYVRQYLNKMGNHFKSLPELGSIKGLLFVEGATEKVFLHRLMENGYFSDRQLSIESYDGKNNKSNKKIKMLIDNYRKIGYDIFIQGDKDGSDIDSFQEHKKSGLIGEANIFQFEYDFETAIPLRLLHSTLIELELVQMDVEEFVQTTSGHEQSILKTIMKEFGIDLERHKVLIGDTLGILLRHVHWRTIPVIKDSELGKFLDFVHKI